MTWNVDEFGMTPECHRELAWEMDQYMLGQRWKALKAMWCRPVIDRWATSRRTDGVIDYVTCRDDEWSFCRGVCATIGVLLGRFWTDAAERQFQAKGRGRAYPLNIAYWDAGSVYGGYTVDQLTLYPGCRVSIFSDGERFL